MAPQPEALRRHYTSFLSEERILLTGHSHQAWPDCAQDGLIEAFSDAAAHVDDKWEKAFAKAMVLQTSIAHELGCSPEEIVLAQNSHELVTRFLSALNWSRGKHLVTTAGEFHSMDRQLRRLMEAGVEVDFVAVQPVSTLAERMAAHVRPDTVGLLASTVLFQSASIVPNLRVAIESAQRVGAQVLLDSYHGFKIAPSTLEALGPDPIFVTAGGYKYAQWGEGCCWMRVPPGCELRPIFTGWFSDFAHLEGPRSAAIGYGPAASRFAGSTYDPSSHYRAARVVEFFHEQGLTGDQLRARSLLQTEQIINGLEPLELVTPRAPEARAGFVAYRVSNASDVVAQLRTHGVFVDARHDILRLGPAPYTTESELERAIDCLRKVLGMGSG